MYRNLAMRPLVRTQVVERQWTLQGVVEAKARMTWNQRYSLLEILG
jgi:hypothetical protein